MAIAPNEQLQYPYQVAPVDTIGATGQAMGEPQRTDELENLAEGMEEDSPNMLAAQCKREWQSDEADRADWLEMHARWIRLYNQQDNLINVDEREWGSEDSLPILAEAVNQYTSRAQKAMFPNQRVIAVKPLGKISQGEWDRADRVRDHMTWQILHRDRGYKKNKRRLLRSKALHGSCFVKTYWDAKKGRVKDENVRAVDLVVPYGTGPRDIEDVERKTHLIWMSVGEGRRRTDQGFFVQEPTKWEDQDQRETTDAENKGEGLSKSNRTVSDADMCLILEQHRWYDFGDGEMPYIVWVDAQKSRTLRVVRRWDDDPTEPVEYFTHYPFIENPDGFYGLGMGHLIGGINTAVNQLLRQIEDSATLANVGNHSGFISNTIAPVGGDVAFRLGEFQKLPGSMEDLARGIFTFKFPGPNQALMEAISLILARGDRLSSVTEMVTGQPDKVYQPTAVLALVEQALEQYSSIYECLFDSWGEELQKRYLLNSKYMPWKEYYTVHDFSTEQPETQEIYRADYQNDFQIKPLADPKMATDQQRLARAQVEWEFIINYHTLLMQMPPEFQPYIYQEAVRYAESIQMDDIEQKISPPPPPPEPKRVDDPMIENMMALMPEQPQVPQVFIDQDHAAHLRAHQEFMMEPLVQDRFPPGGKEAMERHIQMHFAMAYGIAEAGIGETLGQG